jgi:hypothetical protein
MKGIPEEHEKRRSVFWELLNMDCRMVCDGRILLPLLILIFLKESFTWATTVNAASTC